MLSAGNVTLGNFSKGLIFTATVEGVPSFPGGGLPRLEVGVFGSCVQGECHQNYSAFINRPAVYCKNCRLNCF